MAEDPVTVSWKPTPLSANASNNVIPMHGATQVFVVAVVILQLCDLVIFIYP